MVRHDMALVPAAAELHVLPAAVGFVALVVTALFWRGIHSRSCSFLFGRRPAEGELLRPTGMVGSASRSPLPHFTVLCIAVLHAEPLVSAAKQRLHPSAAACAIITFAALVNWATLSLNFSVAAAGSSNPARSAFIALAALMRLKSPNSPTAPDAEGKESHAAATPPSPPVAEPQSPRAAAIAAPALRPHQSRLARAAFVVLCALMSASWFLDPVVAAAGELFLPWPAVVGTLVVFAMCFCTSVHIFRSFFLPRAPAAAAPQWEGIAAIAAVGVGVAACLIAAGGCAYGYAPVRI
ncbi:hypothetical protein SEVIR_2G229450v4 [Setaria viridis]|uniref:Uncharacterized protein n=1 Tax=Setaria viridis TaxID=4556 RepID=A0A4U6VWF9_SETVI|nr:uncharacterized protein LOC117845771 [Setaria viridis]TKW33364.1 hypothetical protein SEVIR_2G229450v2 [Setaria viridis]